MPTPPVLGPAELTFHGHLRNDDEPLFPARITHNGGVAKIFQWGDEEGARDGKRWLRFDTITEAVFTEKGKVIELTGISSTLRNELGLSKEDATVRIEIRSKACKTCG